MSDIFETALAAAEARMQTRETIGRLQEKTLHATLKFYLDPDETHHEVLPPGCTGRLVADIFDGERITEIQNGNFSALRPKLVRLLPQYPVTVVYPLVRRKTLVWIDPADGTTAAPRRSPKVGKLQDALPDFIFIRAQLFDPHLTLRLLPVDVTEYRLRDGWSADGKHGAHRIERVPTAVGEPFDICSPADLAALLPPLPTPFTTADFTAATHFRGRRLSAVISVLREAGCIERIGKDKNRYLYRTVSL